MSAQRPPFRRQGSSVVGGQHPMTVALTPSRVDYSVTKGGARTWAVLLVFMFLCSSLYTVFSAKELAEIAVDLDGDGNLDLDTEVQDDVDEIAAQQKYAIKGTTPTKEEHRGHDRKNEKLTVQEEIETSDDDDAEREADTLEEKLFTNLRAKIQKLNTIVSKKQAEHDKDNEEDDDEEKVLSRKERRRLNKKRQKQMREEVEEGTKEEKNIRKRQLRSSHRQSSSRKEKNEEDGDEEETTEEVEQPQLIQNKKGINKKENKEDDAEKDVDESNEDEKDNEKKHDDDDKDEDDDVDVKNDPNVVGKEKETRQDDHNGEENEDIDERIAHGADHDRNKGTSQKQAKKRRHHRNSHITDSPKRECRRKHCPTDFGQEPRISLLKHQKSQTAYSSKHFASINENFEDDFEEEEVDEDEEEEDDDESEEGNDESDDNYEGAKEGEVVAVKKYRSTGREAYKRHAITNKDDHRYRELLDKADYHVEKHEYKEALAMFDQILKHNDQSPRAHFGKGRAYDIRAEYNSDDNDVDRAIHEYEQVIDNEETTDALFRQAASRLIERTRFRGHMHRALIAQRILIDRFPNEIKLQNDFGLTFLMMKRHDDARKVFKNILDTDPNNAVALAYYGYILKVADGDVEQGVSYMRKGLLRGMNDITDAKIYYHLGEGLMQLGRSAEAYKVYEQGADLGLFLSAHQRSMYNVEGLTARPWWTVQQTLYSKYLKSIERQWVSIRHEALAVLEDHLDEFENENEKITIDGDWKKFRLKSNDEWDEEHCHLMPQTCAILKEFCNSNASGSEIKLSVLSSGTRVLPHCGPTNCRLQAQLGLVVPSEARIRVGTERRGWKTGRFVVFDDSFEHEFVFDGASSSAFRLVLVVDLWHPEIPSRQRADILDNL